MKKHIAPNLKMQLVGDVNRFRKTMTVTEACHKAGISESSYYHWVRSTMNGQIVVDEPNKSKENSELKKQLEQTQRSLLEVKLLLGEHTLQLLREKYLIH